MNSIKTIHFKSKHDRSNNLLVYKFEFGNGFLNVKLGQQGCQKQMGPIK